MTPADSWALWIVVTVVLFGLLYALALGKAAANGDRNLTSDERWGEAWLAWADQACEQGDGTRTVPIAETWQEIAGFRRDELALRRARRQP